MFISDLYISSLSIQLTPNYLSNKQKVARALNLSEFYIRYTPSCFASFRERFLALNEVEYEPIIFSRRRLIDT